MRELPIEIPGLLASIALGLVHIVLAAQSASYQRGDRWSAGPRDAMPPPLQGVAGRLSRACANYLETFPFFAAAILAVLVTNTHSRWSQWGVLLYVGGRLAYLPLYAFGVFLVRSFAWNVATAGIVLVCVALMSGA
jgi:uncharacterized MAPEG superfamily protein